VYMIFPHIDTFWQSAENDMMIMAQHYQLPVLSARCGHAVACCIMYSKSLLSSALCCHDATASMEQQLFTSCSKPTEDLRLCRGAFFDLMMNKVDGFRLDGAHTGHSASEFFFHGDNVHPWGRSYQFLVELCTTFVQQVWCDRAVQWCLARDGTLPLLLLLLLQCMASIKTALLCT
jgi:hypothetical protein